jgi:hypothetical protein
MIPGLKALNMYRRFIQITLLSLFCILFLIRAGAQKVFDFNAGCSLAYKEIMQLKLNSGQALIDAEKKAHPDNLIPYFLENYIDFFVLFFNEDPAEYKARKANRTRRLELMNQGPANSPLRDFTLAIINFQWAAVKVKFGSNWDAGWEFRRSYLLVKDNRKAFPSFAPNDMLYGAMQVVTGSIPKGYKWLSNMMGMRGSINTGMDLLNGFLGKKDEWTKLFEEEGIFYYLYLKFHIENKPEEVFSFIKRKGLDLKNNHLFAYMAANLYINNKQSALAKSIIVQRNNSREYLSTPVWNLELGYAKLYHNEPDAAVYLQRFADQFKGRFYLKDALQKLSWHYYLLGNMNLAMRYRSKVLEYGSTDTEADKQAKREAESGIWPHPLLLKARLLNDGGYHHEALEVLQGKSTSFFPRETEKVEFAYRLARIYDDLGWENDALQAYFTTIKTGRQLPTYFAARAALQAGYIYEKRREKARAIYFFEQCLSMEDHDYKNSLDQRAKAGIARCKGD